MRGSGFGVERILMGRERDPLDYLSEAWRQLRLSVRCPARVPTWDAVVLTAASPAQAELYQRHLERAQANGIIATETVVLAVPDPEGRRIGSGAATIHALRSLAHHLQVRAASLWINCVGILAPA